MMQFEIKYIKAALHPGAVFNGSVALNDWEVEQTEGIYTKLYTWFTKTLHSHVFTLHIYS